MKDPDRIREALARAAKDRRAADAAHEKATAELRRLLREVKDTEGVSMTEAARIVGVSREMAHRLARE